MEMNENGNGKSKILLSVLGVAILVVAVIGISFAIYTNTFDSDENSITTGTIMVSYSEPTNGISITDALPISDASGKVLDGEGETFEFTVSTKANGELTIPYIISLTKDTESSTLEDSQVKVYLTKGEDGSESVVEPTKVSELTSYAENGRENSYILYGDAKDVFTGSEDKATTTKYTLRMWVDQDVEMDSIQESKTYTLKVNVDSAVKPLSNQ